MLSIRRPSCQRAPTLKKAKVHHSTAIAAASNTLLSKRLSGGFDKPVWIDDYTATTKQNLATEQVIIHPHRP
jgi:hypothetical protein